MTNTFAADVAAAMDVLGKHGCTMRLTGTPDGECTCQADNVDDQIHVTVEGRDAADVLQTIAGLVQVIGNSTSNVSVTAMQP